MSTLSVRSLHGPGSCDVAFVLTDDGETCLVTAGGDGKVCIRDVSTMSEKRSYFESKPIEALAVHSGSRLIAIGVDVNAKVSLRRHCQQIS
jgi:hypothetical protein